MKAGVTTRYNLKRTTATKLFELDFEFGTRTVNITEQQCLLWVNRVSQTTISIIKGPW